jgi:hypothetical protein
MVAQARRVEALALTSRDTGEIMMVNGRILTVALVVLGLALSSPALAGFKGRGKKSGDLSDPASRTVACIDVTTVVSACTPALNSFRAELDSAAASVPSAFTSRNGTQDYVGLTCKVENAKIKEEVGKIGDAVAIMTDSEAKIETLRDSNKLEAGAAANLLEDASFAIDCLCTEYPGTCL